MTTWVTSWSPHTAPPMLLPFHFRLTVARPLPETTPMGRETAILLAPKVTFGVSVFSLAVTRLTVTRRS